MDIEGIIEKFCEVRYWKDSQEVSSVKLKKTQRKCPDCDLIVDSDRRVHINLNVTPMPHWKQHCNKCRQCANPETGKFDMSSREVSTYYYFKNKEEANNRDK